MTDAQKEWLAQHPEFKHWNPHPIVSIKGWTDIGWLMPYGKVVPDGEHLWAYRGNHTHLMSSGDTLYVMPKDAFKIGREFYIC